MNVKDHDGEFRVITINRYGGEIDSQRKRLYRWEHTMEHEFEILETWMIKACIAKACLIVDVEAPRLTLSTAKSKNACYIPQYHEIRLPAEQGSWAHNLLVVLHETAHAIHERLGKSWEASHGGGFLAIEIFLLDQMTHKTSAELKISAREAGLEVGSLINYMK